MIIITCIVVFCLVWFITRAMTASVEAVGYVKYPDGMANGCSTAAGVFGIIFILVWLLFH